MQYKQAVRACQGFHRWRLRIGGVMTSWFQKSVRLLCLSPRSGFIAQPRVAQRTLGDQPTPDALRRRRCIRCRGRPGCNRFAVKTVGVGMPSQGGCATLGCAIQPLRGKDRVSRPAPPDKNAKESSPTYDRSTRREASAGTATRRLRLMRSIHFLGLPGWYRSPSIQMSNVFPLERTLA